AARIRSHHAGHAVDHAIPGPVTNELAAIPSSVPATDRHRLPAAACEAADPDEPRPSDRIAASEAPSRPGSGGSGRLAACRAAETTERGALVGSTACQTAPAPTSPTEPRRQTGVTGLDVASRGWPRPIDPSSSSMTTP